MARLQCDITDYGQSSWGESTNRFPVDTLLRKHGYRIHSRRPGRTEWIKDGEVYSQEDALAGCPRKEVLEATGEISPVKRGCY